MAKRKPVKAYMAQSTRQTIKWQFADYTYSPWTGCSSIHSDKGCNLCVVKSRYYQRNLTPDAPLKWDRKAYRNNEYKTVYTSDCDVFDPNLEDESWRTEFFKLVESCTNLIWMVSTRWPEHIFNFMPDTWKRRNEIPHQFTLGISASTMEDFFQRWKELTQLEESLNAPIHIFAMFLPLRS